MVTQHPEPPDLVHEQRGDDVPGQNGQSSQKTDKIDHVGVVLVADVAEHAALFVVQKSAVDQSAVDQPVLKKIWNVRCGGGVEDGVGGWKRRDEGNFNEMSILREDEASFAPLKKSRKHLQTRATAGPTCVVEEGGDEGAVLEEGVAGGDILKVTLLKQ